MGNFIIGHSLLTLLSGLTITTTSEDSSFSLDNVKNYTNLLRHYRSVTSASDVRIAGTWGGQKALTAIMLNDVNFASVTIQGNDTDVWTSPSFSQAFTISKDARVNRRKAYCRLTNFNYTFFSILIPAQTPDDFNVFRIGTLVPVATQIELSQNPNWGYSWNIKTPEPRILNFPSGQSERSSRGNIAWLNLSMNFDPFIKSYENELYTLSRIDNPEHLVIFENFGDVPDTSKCCLCYRDTDLEVAWSHVNLIKTSRLDFTEAI